ncbi:hypothetical protein SUGI_0040170 [Cryptomeria japonica]|nr:hypothetical protein SUGI_0040170 [Cryptomeria japonica]
MDIINKLDNSLVIVTNRDVGVLITGRITDGYRLKEMDKDQGSELFCWHAFDQPMNPSSGYEELVNSFVNVCGGLPLSLQVLGRHVRGRNEDYWRKRIAEKVWEVSGWNYQHALQTLRDKCLLEETDIYLRMHDHLRDLGREMAFELGPPHRLWRHQDLEYLESRGFRKILTKTNIRCFHSIFDKSMNSQVTFFFGQTVICGETSASLLWLEIMVHSYKKKRKKKLSLVDSPSKFAAFENQWHPPS